MRLGNRKCIYAALLLASTLPISADQFTNPSNSVADLTNTYKIGQDVQLAWNTTLDTITLLVVHWGGADVGSLLC